MSPKEGGKRLYQLLIPNSIFGNLTEQELAKKVTLDLPVGVVQSLFRILKEEQIELSEEAPTEKLVTFPASVMATWLMLKTAEDARLPINPILIISYKRYSQFLIDNKPEDQIADLIRNLEIRDFDPFTRELKDKERELITRVPILVEQLDEVGQVVLRRFKQSLEGGVNDSVAVQRFMEATGILSIILNGVRKARLNLPVNENFIRITEAAFHHLGAEETRI